MLTHADVIIVLGNVMLTHADVIIVAVNGMVGLSHDGMADSVNGMNVFCDGTGYTESTPHIYPLSIHGEEMGVRSKPNRLFSSFSFR